MPRRNRCIAYVLAVGGTLALINIFESSSWTLELGLGDAAHDHSPAAHAMAGGNGVSAGTSWRSMAAGNPRVNIHNALLSYTITRAAPRPPSRLHGSGWHARWL